MGDRVGMVRPLCAAARLAFFAASALPQLAEAASCTVGAGVSTIGNEYFATAAYPDGSYEYQVTTLLCSGGVPRYLTGNSFYGTSAAVIQAYRSLHFTRVFRNQCGSMGLLAHDQFLGTLNDGVATVNLAPVSYTHLDVYKRQW